MNPADYRLGKLEPKHPGIRHAMAAHEYLAQLPPAPETCDWTRAVSFPAGAMGNDKLGDCTAAGIGHWIQVATANNGKEVTPSDDDVVTFYSATTGYVRGDASTDQGGVEADVLQGAKLIGLGGYKIDGFARGRETDLVQARQITNTFLGAYLGLALPNTIWSQGDVWDVDLTAGKDAERGSAGGHCVIVEGYDKDGLFIITWGLKKYITNAFFSGYNDELWALLANGLCAPNGKTPAGDLVPAYDGFLAAVGQ